MLRWKKFKFIMSHTTTTPSTPSITTHTITTHTIHHNLHTHIHHNPHHHNSQHPSQLTRPHPSQPTHSHPQPTDPLTKHTVRSGVNVEFSQLSFHFYSSSLLTHQQIDDIVDCLHKRLETQETNELNQLHHFYHTLSRHVSIHHLHTRTPIKSYLIMNIYIWWSPRFKSFFMLLQRVLQKLFCLPG